MLPHNTEYDKLSSDEVLAKTSKLFKDVEDSHLFFIEHYTLYKSRINKLFAQQSTDKITELIDLINEPAFIKCCQYSQEFLIFEIMKHIIPLEQKNNLPYSINQYSDLDELVETYNKIVFCMRRIEFDFPLESQMDLIAIIRKYSVSPVYIYYILTSALLNQRKNIAIQLSNIYTCMDEPKWALLFETFSSDVEETH